MQAGLLPGRVGQVSGCSGEAGATLSAAVLPPVLGPVMMTQRVPGATHTSIGTGGEGLSSASLPAAAPASLLLDCTCRATVRSLHPREARWVRRRHDRTCMGRPGLQ